MSLTTAWARRRRRQNRPKASRPASTTMAVVLATFTAAAGCTGTITGTRPTSDKVAPSTAAPASQPHQSPAPVPHHLNGIAIDDRPYVGPPYDEDAWRGKGWADPDGNGCDAREDALIAASLTTTRQGQGCKILGGRWLLVYVNGETTDPAVLDIDHVVALAVAHRSGGAHWPAPLRAQFTNDPLNLLPVARSANRSKGDRTPAEWQPGTPTGRCTMANRYIAVAAKYNLTITTPTRDALARLLEDC